MKQILIFRTLGTIMGLLFLSSCATTPHQPAIVPATDLPADVTMNRLAGRGNYLIIKLHLEDGKELPFVVDTGIATTSLSDELESKLGTRLGEGIDATLWGVKYKWSRYPAPKLYLGNMPLMTGSNIFTHNLFKKMSAVPGCAIMGILGMDCLEHYCLQLDFGSGKMRFLGAKHSEKQNWGKAFPMAVINGYPPAIYENLAGLKKWPSVIDTAYGEYGNGDGWLTPKVFEQWTNGVTRPVHGEARSPNGVLGGDGYPHIKLGNHGKLDFNGIGLCFLARHCATLDFPDGTMYLRRTSIGPLSADDNIDTGHNFLKSLKEGGRLPGWSKKDGVNVLDSFYCDVYPVSGTCKLQKTGDPSIYHYVLSRASEDSPWKMKKAWRTDKSGILIEEYPVP